MNNINPLISIGLVTYNRPEQIIIAIESVLSQTYSNIELLISDDSSNDLTKNKIEPYLINKKVKYVKQNRIGMTDNFKKVMNASKGEYFMWLCDDDYLDEYYIEKCYNYLALNQEYSIVCGKTNFFDKQGLKKIDDILYLEDSNSLNRIKLYFKNVNKNVVLYGLMRKSQIINLEYPNLFGADLFWIAQLIFLGKAKIIEDTYFYYSLEGISKETYQLSNYYSNKNKRINPYKEFNRNIFYFIAFGNNVYNKLGFISRVKFASKIWIILRERFCKSVIEIQIRSKLKIRTRTKKLFKI